MEVKRMIESMEDEDERGEYGRCHEEVTSFGHGEMPQGEATRCYNKENVKKMEPGEAVEETGQGRKETQTEEIRKLLEKDIYDINAIKRLGRLQDNENEDEDIPIRPIQQTETWRSIDCTDDFLSLSVRDVSPAASSALTKEKEAEERRMLVLQDTDRNNFSSDKYKKLEPAHEPSRGQVTHMKRSLNISQHHRLCKLHMSERGQKPDTDKVTLFNKSEENQKPEGKEMSAPVHQFSTPQGTQKSDSGQKPDAAAVSLTTACTPLPIKPAETKRSDRWQTPVSDEPLQSLTTEHQETDKTEKAQKQKPVADDGSSKSSCILSLLSGITRPAAPILFFLMLAAMISPAAGPLCVGKQGVVPMEVQKGEVGLVCPVTTNLHQTAQSATITYVNFLAAREEVLVCDWLKRLDDFECTKSDYGAQLIAIEFNRVLVRMPEDRVQQTGFYTCHLTPANPNQRFPRCDICHPADPTTTTVSNVTLSATGDPPEPDDPQNRAVAPSAACGGLVTAVVVLTFAVVLLLLSLIGLVILYLKTPEAQTSSGATLDQAGDP